MLPASSRLLKLIPAWDTLLELNASPLKCNMIPHLIHQSELLSKTSLLANHVTALLHHKAAHGALGFIAVNVVSLWSHFR